MNTESFINLIILIWFGTDLVADVSAGELDWGFIVVDAVFVILVLVDLIRQLVKVRKFSK